MPRLITRAQALEEIGSWMRPGDCLMCRLFEKQEAYVLEKNEHITVFLSQYPRFWGQVMVAFNRHAEQYSELRAEEWAAASHAMLHYAQQIETLLRPVRVYVCGLGSTQPLLMSCPHLHINIMPVYDPMIKPSEVLTWREGVYAATEEEWKALQELFTAAR